MTRTSARKYWHWIRRESMHRIKTALLGTCGALLLTLLVAGGLAAQEITGSIRGAVFDPSGAGVPGAKVSATQTETGLTRTALSNREGGYVLVLLPLGHYRVEASAEGFRKFVQEGITLSVNETASVPVHLTVGCATQP